MTDNTSILGKRNPPLPDPAGTIEPTQDHMLSFMRDAGFTHEQIEANREYNGRLYLSPAVFINPLRFQSDTLVNTVTGEVVIPKETEELIALKRSFERLLSKAVRRLTDEDEALQSFCTHIKERTEQVENLISWCKPGSKAA